MKHVATIVDEFCEQSGRRPDELLVYLLDGLRVHHARLRAAPHADVLSEVQALSGADPARRGVPQSALDLLARHVRVHNLSDRGNFHGEAAVLLRILQGCMGDAGADERRAGTGPEPGEAASP